MTQKLARSLLVIGLGLVACAAAERPRGVAGEGGQGGASGAAGKTAASDGAAGTAASGGTGGGGSRDPSSLTGDAAADGAAAMSHLDGGPAAGDLWAKCGPESFKPDISATDFCARYMTACGFDPTGGAGGKSRYKSLDDCVAKYNALSDGPRGGRACVAYHLCVAGFPETKETFCPHAPEASAMTGPCKAAYL